MSKGEKHFEEGLALFRQHEYASAAELFAGLKEDGFPHPDLDLYIRVARREGDRLCRFVESYSASVPSVLHELADREREISVGPMQVRFSSAREAVEAGKHEEALASFNNIIKSGAGCFCVHLGAARSCLALGRLQEALDHAEEAKRRQPDDSRAFGILGSILLELYREREAAEAFKDALELDDRNAGAWYGLATLHFEGKHYSLAESCVRKALLIKPGWIGAASLLDEVVRLGDETEKLIDDCLKAIAEHPEYADQHHQLGVCYTYQGRYDEAVKCFDKALQINANLVKTIVQRANVFIALERYEDACRDFRTAVEAGAAISVDSVAMNEAWRLEKAKDFAAAADRYADALRVTPDFAANHIETGRKFFEVGLIEQAEREIRQGLEIASDYADGFCLLGFIYQSKDKLDKAERYFAKALELNPLYEEAAIELIKFYLKQSDEEKAKAILQAWHSREREVPVALTALFASKGEQ